jgi:hypothetical protein
VRGSFLGGCSGAGRLGVSYPRRAGGRRSGGRGGNGARVSGCCAEELKRRIEWSRPGEAREQEIRGPKGVLGPCRGGGELLAGRRSGRRGACGKGLAGAS